MHRSRRRALRRVLPRRSLLALLLGLALALGLPLGLEGGARALGVQPTYQPQALGWSLQANLSSFLLSPPGQDPFVVTTNADGLRTAAARAKPPGVRRLAIVGDSTTFGWGVSEGGTVADGMQAAMGAGWEVINGGQPGYSSAQALGLVTQTLLAYQPDVVVLFVPMHDFNEVWVSDAEQIDAATQHALGRARVWLVARSRAYALLRAWWMPVDPRPFRMPQEAHEPGRVPRVSDDERTRLADQAHAALRAQGGQLWVGMLPFQGDLQRGPSTPAPRLGLAWMEAWSAAHGTPLLDGRACCDPASARAYVLPHDPGHLSAEGNLAAGRFLGKKILTANGI